jgi:N-acetylglucosaminyldiphosphoundecaprenol N-acetyl-beta-D-mannosaminyltransferase
VACATYETALQAAKELARADKPAQICAANTHIVSQACHNPAFGRVIRSYDLLLPDGAPLLWALNLQGAGLKDRVYGPYFMRHALAHLGKPWRHFFFGGKETTLRQLAKAAQTLNPGIEIAGLYSPPYRPWTEEDEQEFARIIQNARPDFIWVALGGERQETWIHRNLHRHARGVFIAVGDAFELLAGNRAFAPRWMQRLGLTWLYRLLQEPRRLWPRYLKYNSLFLLYAARSLLPRFFRGARPDSAAAKPPCKTIAFLGSRGVPARYSGFETVVEELGSRLAERGYAVTVYNRPSYYRDLPKYKTWKGMRIVWLPTLPSKNLDTIIHTTLSFLHALFQRYDLVYLCGVGNAPLGRFFSFFMPGKLIINVDGADYRRAKWGLGGRLWLKMSEAQAVKAGTIVIADNPEVAKRYRLRYGCGAHLLAYGSTLRTEPVEAGVCSRFGLHPEGYFLYVGRLTPENEASLAIQGYLLYLKHRSTAADAPKLVITGHAWYENDYFQSLQAWAAPAGDAILFTGAQFGKAYHELSQKALAFVLPSTIEATRLVLLDQMGFGKAILYRDCPATRHVIGEAGLPFGDKGLPPHRADSVLFGDPDTPPTRSLLEDLAGKYQLLEEDAVLRKRLEEQALQRAKAEFQWNAIADRYDALFQA